MMLMIIVGYEMDTVGRLRVRQRLYCPNMDNTFEMKAMNTNLYKWYIHYNKSMNQQI